jgi:hypothetical protein
MTSFRNLNFNNGQSVNLGYVTYFWEISGYAPIETVCPTSIKVNKFKKEVEKNYSSELPGAISRLGWSFETFDEANTALSEVAEILQSQYWLWGSLETGGCFIWSAPNSGECHFHNFYGLYHIDDIIQGSEYTYYSGGIVVPFRCHINNDKKLPIVDNELFLFNVNYTEENAPKVNHNYNSEIKIKCVDCRSLNRYIGDDYEWLGIWNQNQWIEASTSVSDWKLHYLYEYTTDNLADSNPHPWKRWKQSRVITNIEWFLGIEVANGELVGGYVPIENSDAVTCSDNDPNGDSGGPPGGDGDKNALGDDVGTGGTPSSNFLQTGIARIYLPTQQVMTAFSHYVFTDITQSTIDQLKKMWSNPMDYIQNLGVCRLAGITASGSSAITFGGVSSGITSDYTNEAFRQFDYECKLGEYWGNALDYSNYTKLKIYIPYCGLYDLNIDEFMISNNNGGCTITLRYRVDLMSGMCVAMVRPSRAQYGSGNYSNFNSFLYQFNGNIFLPLSLTATDWRNTYQSVLGIAGGMIAPSPASVTGMAESVMSQKVNVQHSGSIGTNFGYMGIQEPYLIIERPALSEPYYNNNYKYETEYGYPSNKMTKLSYTSGFVKARKGSFWANNIHCTDDERKEIISLLETEGIWV